MADFQKHFDEFKKLGVSVFAMSTDPRQEALETVRKNTLAYTVLYDLDGEEIAQKIGAYYEHRRHIIQPCAFILQWGKVVNATYSSGPVGRLNAADALALIRFLQQRSETS